METDHSGVLEINICDPRDEITFPVFGDSCFQKQVPFFVRENSKKEGLIFWQDLFDKRNPFLIGDSFRNMKISISAVILFYGPCPVFSVSIDIKSLLPGLLPQIKGKGKGRPKDSCKRFQKR